MSILIKMIGVVVLLFLGNVINHYTGMGFDKLTFILVTIMWFDLLELSVK